MSHTICFDIRALQIGHENRGIGMYVKSVLEHLPADDNNYILYCFDKNDPVVELGLKLKFNYKLIQTASVNTALESPKHALDILRLVYHHFAPLRKNKPDTFVQFDASLGVPRWKQTSKVVIGYDLIPLIMQNEYNPTVKYAWRHAFGKRAKLRALLRSSYYNIRYWMTFSVYKRADKVVCISQASADSFGALLKISKEKIISVPLAPVLTRVQKTIKPNLAKPYVFYIGGTDTRKRVVDIVRAFNVARGRGLDIELVLAGNEFKNITQIPDVEARNAIMSSPYLSDIHAVGFVSDEEKAGFYESALAFIFASQYEGFGLPVVEAMAMGCPVIAYNNSSIPEAAGKAALLVETRNYLGISHQIQHLVEDASLRSRLIKAGLAQSKKFGWDSYVKSFTEIVND